MKLIRSALNKLRAERPGRRFRSARREAESRKGGKMVRPMLLLLGVVLVAAGIFFMAVPGPGLPVLLAGLALISLASRRTARLLDRAEVLILQAADGARKRWTGAPPWVKIFLVTSGLLLAGALTYALLRVR